MIFRHALSRRDAVLLLLGASLMHIFTFFFPPFKTDSIVINTHLHDSSQPEVEPLPPPAVRLKPVIETVTVTSTVPEQTAVSQAHGSYLPETSIIHHAPGWTLFENLYMAHGTLYIVTSEPKSFPEVRMMTSSGLAAENTPENIALREPAADNMDFLTPQEAKNLWNHANNVLTVEGNTLLFNDPSQFLRHYYHLVAELFFGVQAFWHGAFSKPSPPSEVESRLIHPSVPAFDRAIFAHSNANGWRDNPGFNSYFVRAAFPSLTVEHQEDWEDRIKVTSGSSKPSRVWRFPLVLLTDRSAAHRGTVCGSQTQRTAAEAWEYMKSKDQLMGLKTGGWWEPVRAAVLRFAGVEGASDMKVYQAQNSPEGEHQLPMPEKVVITYISRQAAPRRKLTNEAHQSLVSALSELADKRGDKVELNIVEAEKLSKDEQLKFAGRTHIMLGVHGNGLTHLVFMPPTRISTVIEIFYPHGFAHDYQWTTHALGMKHFAVWNDTHYTLPNKPKVDYPEGFQGNYIPVHGPTVAQLIEDRIDGKL